MAATIKHSTCYRISEIYQLRPVLKYKCGENNRRVQGTSERSTHIVALFVEVDRPSQSEVGDLDDVSIGNEHVPCRQISVNYLQYNHPFNHLLILFSSSHEQCWK